MLAKLKLPAVAGFSLTLLLFAYSNHFDNGFRFDDYHTIVQNTAIRDIKNVPSFFVDGTTSSALPQNQAYRPLSTALHALDYWMGGGLEPRYFHRSIFIAYVLQLLLLYIFYKSVFDQAEDDRRNALVAILVTAFYGLHTANAETINYIGARTDSFSTLLVLASLLLYRWKATRRLQLHIVAMVLGIYTKQTALMFVPILFLYVLFFDPDRPEEAGQAGWPKWARFRRAISAAAPPFVIGATLLFVNQRFLTPGTTVSSNAAVSRLDYLLTQAYVVTHYLSNFIFPLDLSADPDFKVIGRFSDTRVLWGVVACLALLSVSAYSAKRRSLRPISFGILWFFIALAPTSSVIPLYQVANDHRTFFPYIGLALSVGWALELVLRRRLSGKTIIAKVPVATALVLLLCAHAYGVHQRNRVWSSEEALWLDVTRKSPENGRGLMNYGLSQMEQGKYQTAYDYYQKALEIEPYYPYLHVNLGIVLAAMGREDEAEQHFRSGLRYGNRTPSTYLYYGKWLRKQGRSDEALAMLERANELSPGHAEVQSLLQTVKEEVAADAARTLVSQEQAARALGSAQAYLGLGLSYYRLERYAGAVAAWEKAATLAPESAIVQNNLCSGYMKIGKPERAVKACERALTIEPTFQRAKANLDWAQNVLADQQSEQLRQ